MVFIVSLAYNLEFMHYEEAHRLFGLLSYSFILASLASTTTQHIRAPFSIRCLTLNFSFRTLAERDLCSRLVVMSHNTKNRSENPTRILPFQLRILLLNMHCVPIVVLLLLPVHIMLAPLKHSYFL